MYKVGRNSVIFENAYLVSSGTVGCKKEHEGPLGKYIDKCYDDLYAGNRKWFPACFSGNSVVRYPSKE